MLKPKDFVEPSTLKTLKEIDGMVVLEEYLLFKGTDHIKEFRVHIGHLEDMAHVHYGLKVNATNELYVAAYLTKFYKRANMFIEQSSQIRIPKDMFERIDTLHKSYKTKDNQQEE